MKNLLSISLFIALNISILSAQTDIICTQAYYPDTEGYTNSLASQQYNFNNHLLLSNIWTYSNVPYTTWFYLNFDLSDYKKLQDTYIQNIYLLLYHTTQEYSVSYGYGGSASNKSNNIYSFHRVISNWDKNTISWNNRPTIDANTYMLTPHIAGTVPEPDYTSNHVFNLNKILLNDNSELYPDYHGVMCKPYLDDITDYYRRFCVSSTAQGDTALFPTLKVEYKFPKPDIAFDCENLYVINNYDLKTLFNNVDYEWVIDKSLTLHGETVSVLFSGKTSVELKIKITNNVGEKYEFTVEKQIASCVTIDASDDYAQILCYSPPSTTIDVFANDTMIHCNRSEINLAIASASKVGATATVDENQNIVYTHITGFVGRDTLEYSINCNDTIYAAKVFIIVVECPDNISNTECFIDPPATEWSIKEAWRSLQENISTYTAPVIGDVDGDGIPEIFVARGDRDTYQGIYCYKGNDRNNPVLINTEKGTPLSISVFALAKVPVFGVDKYLIFMIGKDDGKIYAYDANSTGGTWLWRSDQPVHSAYSSVNPVTELSINLADFDNDGVPEIYSGGRIFDATNGNLLAEVPSGGNIGLHRYLRGNNEWIDIFSIAANVLGDEKLELCVGTEVYNVNIVSKTNPALNSLTLATKIDPVFIHPDLTIKDGLTVVADVNRDGILDVIVSSGTYEDRYAGMIVWTPSTGQLLGKGLTSDITSQMAVPLVGNIDNNPDLEIVQVITNRLNAYRLDAATQSITTFYSMVVDDPSGRTGITLFDFNSDGEAELLYRDEANLRILKPNSSGSFTDINTFPATSGTRFEHPLVADVDNDNQAEIIVIGGEQKGAHTGTLRIYKSAGSGWAPARKVWNQYAYNVVNVNEDLTIPKYQFNPATVFPNGKQPFNNFLQQQTLLNSNGDPLWILPEVNDTIYRKVCFGETYNFYGQILSTTGVYKYDQTTQAGCDSIITLYLTINPAFNDTIYKTVCYREPYDFYGQTLSNTGIYTHKHTTQEGCDSIITLYLTVVEKFETKFDDSITAGEDYNKNGFSIQTQYEAGTFTFPQTLHSVAGCDSTVTLTLHVIPSNTFLVEWNELLEICGDAPDFTVNFKLLAGQTTSFSLQFDEKALNAGFVNVTDNVLISNKIQITLPENIRPDNYFVSITIKNRAGLILRNNLYFTVLYPSSVIEQKWNDVLALLNDRYNGGYIFSDYQWYKNGEPIAGATGSYFYNKAVDFDFVSEYRAKITRIDDGVSLFTCGVVPVYRELTKLVLKVDFENGQIIINAPQNLKLTIWNILGIKVSEYQIGTGMSNIPAPSHSGNYILSFETAEGILRSERIYMR